MLVIIWAVAVCVISIESGLITYSPDDATRIDCEHKLFSFNNELLRLEKKLAKRNKNK